MTAEPDFIDDDAQAYWLGALDIRADPTGRPGDRRVILAGKDLAPEQARRLAEQLVAAADYCEGRVTR